MSMRQKLNIAVFHTLNICTFCPQHFKLRFYIYYLLSKPHNWVDCILRKYFVRPHILCSSANHNLQLYQCVLPWFQVYELRVLETKPGRAVSIIECDMNVCTVYGEIYNYSKLLHSYGSTET